jgi:predicted CoA-binding protein
MENVAVIGASLNKERYSNRAMKTLIEKGHNAIPVSLDGKDVEGQKGYKSLRDVPDNIDTVSLYLSPEKQKTVIEDIKTVSPKRVIFSSGAENNSVYKELESKGIEVLEACTIVMLTTWQF